MILQYLNHVHKSDVRQAACEHQGDFVSFGLVGLGQSYNYKRRTNVRRIYQPISTAFSFQQRERGKHSPQDANPLGVRIGWV